jgi:hypothetical protein
MTYQGYLPLGPRDGGGEVGVSITFINKTKIKKK